MSDFMLLRPWWLLALVPALMIALLLARHRGRDNPWRLFVDPHLLPGLLVPLDQRRTRGTIAGFAAIWCLAAVILAGPSIGSPTQVFYRQVSAPLVVVLDLSSRMDRGRLASIKGKLHGFLERLPPRPIGLVVYSRYGHDVFPLTEDRRVVQAVLPKLDPALMPTPDANPAEGIRRAVNLVIGNGNDEADILWVSDDPGSVPATAVPTGFRLNAYTVSSQRDSLVTVTEKSGGSVIAWQGNDADIEDILEAVDRAPPVSESEERPSRTFRIDLGPWLMLLLVPLVALTFRRGWLAVAVVLICPPVEAADWNSLWQRPDQRAQALLRKGMPSEAAELYRDPMWRGIALAQDGRWLEAAEAFSALDTTDGRYNRAVALARGGRWPEAMDLFDLILADDPGHADAAFNRGVVGKALEVRQREAAQAAPPVGKKGQNTVSKDAVQEEPLAFLDVPNPSAVQVPKGTEQAKLDLKPGFGGAAIVPPQAEHTVDDEADEGNEDRAPSTLGQASKHTPGSRTDRTSGIPGRGRGQSDDEPGEQEQTGMKPGEGDGDGEGEPDTPSDLAQPRQAGARDQQGKSPSAGTPDAAGGPAISGPWMAMVPDDPTPYLSRRFRYQMEQRLKETAGGNR